jgi:hypothetical protein
MGMDSTSILYKYSLVDLLRNSQGKKLGGNLYFILFIFGFIAIRLRVFYTPDDQFS